MQLNNLKSIKSRSKRRLGQGHGSGRVKTSGRGTKGQNARSSRPLSFEGGALPLIKRLPFRRGKGKNKAFKKLPVVINIKALDLLKDGVIVDLKSLVAAKIVLESDAKEYGVKILGDGEITKKLIINLPISKRAADKIKKAGGSIGSESAESKTEENPAAKPSKKVKK